MLCAHCERCGRRSALGQGTASLSAPTDENASVKLRCDMCGCRRVRVFRAQGPVEMLAFLSGRI